METLLKIIDQRSCLSAERALVIDEYDESAWATRVPVEEVAGADYCGGWDPQDGACGKANGSTCLSVMEGEKT